MICVGGPLDGDTVGDRGEWFQPITGAGLYVRQGDSYLWRPHTIRNMRQSSDNLREDAGE